MILILILDWNACKYKFSSADKALYNDENLLNKNFNYRNFRYGLVGNEILEFDFSNSHKVASI